MHRVIVPAGDVEWARFTSTPPRFIENSKNNPNRKQKFTRQQKEGLRYEKRAIEYLEKTVALQTFKRFHLLPSPWIMFKSKGNAFEQSYQGFRFCQPDSLLVNAIDKIVIIVEIKYQHTSEAWRQVKLLYEPVVKKIGEFEGFNIRCLELSKWLDPHSSFPEQYYYEENILECKSDCFGVHLYKPSRNVRKKVKK